MKLLVAVDGSAASDHAVRHALSLAGVYPQTTLVLLNVQNRETLEVSDIVAADVGELAAARSAKALHKAVAACEAANVPFETRAEFGPICETIIHTARTAAADQIIMGTRGLGRLRGLVLGSVTTGVIQHAHIPVTLVK